MALRLLLIGKVSLIGESYEVECPARNLPEFFLRNWPFGLPVQALQLSLTYRCTDRSYIVISWSAISFLTMVW